MKFFLPVKKDFIETAPYYRLYIEIELFMKDYKKQTSANQQRKNRISSKTGVPNSFRPAWEGQCPLYKKCNGCQMQNLAYEEQLAWKESKVRKLLGKFCRVEAIHGMENPKYYRNKVQALFRLNQRKQIVSGIYQSSTRGLIPVDNCLLEDQECDRIIVTIRTLLKSFKLFPYDGRKGTGFLRHVLVRKGFATGEIMVVLVTAKPMFPSKKNFINALLQAHPQITTIIQNISDQPMELVLGEREQVLYGPGVVRLPVSDFVSILLSGKPHPDRISLYKGGRACRPYR